MISLAIAVLSFVVAVLLRRRPHLVVSLTIALAIIVPIQVSAVEGLFLPAAWYLAIAHTFVQLASGNPAYLRASRSHRLLLLVAFALALYMVVSAWALDERALSATAGALRLVVVPVCFFISVRAAIDGAPAAARFIIRTVIVLALVESALAWAQYLTGDVLVWQSYFKRNWWVTDNYVVSQTVGTLGHWIPLSVFLAASIPLIWTIKNVLVRLLLLVAVIATLFTTSSRTGLLLAVVVVALLLLTSLSLQSFGRTLVAGVSALGIGVVAMFILGSTLSERVLGRLEDDAGSNDLRFEAIRWMQAHWTEFVFAGYEGNRDLRGSGVLRSSLENGFFMFAVEFGVVAAVLLIIVMLAAAVRSLRVRGLYMGVVLAGVVAISISFTTSGSFGTGDVSSIVMFWLFCALGYVPRGDESTSKADESGESRTAANLIRTAS